MIHKVVVAVASLTGSPSSLTMPLLKMSSYLKFK